MTSMHSSSSSRDAGQQIHWLLSQVQRRRQWVRRGRVGWAIFWMTLALLLAVLLADAMWHLPAMVRAMAAGLIVAGVVALPVGIWLVGRGHGVEGQLLDDAMSVEAHHDLRDNALVNGLFLGGEKTADTGQGSTALTEALRQRVVGDARAAAERADLTAAVDRQPLARQQRIALQVLVVMLVVALVMPRLFGEGMVRLVDPWGDHPPFSLTRFAVALPAEGVMQGEDAMVGVRLAGLQPGEVSWVELDAAGKEVSRWPLEQTGDRTYQKSLHEVREDVVFRIETPTGRTRAMRVKVVPQPMVAMGEEQPQPAREAIKPPPPPAASEKFSDHPDMKSMGECRNQLIAAAQALTQAAAPRPGDLQEQAMQVAEAADHLTRLSREFGVLAKSAAQRTGEDAPPAEVRAALESFADMLDELQTPQQPAMPKGKADQPAADQECKGWCDNMGKAGAADLKKLQEGMKDRPSNRKPGGAGNQPGQSDIESGYLVEAEPNALTDPHRDPRAGVYLETRSDSGRDVDDTSARSARVPAEYRQKVQQYFDRINEDQQPSSQSQSQSGRQP